VKAHIQTLEDCSTTKTAIVKYSGGISRNAAGIPAICCSEEEEKTVNKIIL
jgi:hypothetical protein